jgi:hypothetical protein
MAGGFKHFGPTYPTTDYVRLGYEGDINGIHPISATLVQNAMSANGEANAELAGSFAAMADDGVTTAAAGGKNAIGLFREDLHDMVNASNNASFYFRGGEYYVQEARLGAVITTFKVGDNITSDANGKIVKATDSDRVLGTVTHIGPFKNGNMYEWAGLQANGGNYLGFIMHI